MVLPDKVSVWEPKAAPIKAVWPQKRRLEIVFWCVFILLMGRKVYQSIKTEKKKFEKVFERTAAWKIILRDLASR